uniref:Uncharacterized protein n=1 Tax=Chenopodium quinoa TaxID=63459 RepID=A0A803MIT4_CHEQI
MTTASFFTKELFGTNAAVLSTTLLNTIFLLTIPPSVGYEQNPLSLYYCYDQENSSTSLKKCIAEVTNTPWGERVSFVFNPSSDVVAKALHVSPFMDMQGSWKIKATAPRNDLSVVISVHHPDLGEHFCAILRAQRVSSSKVDQLFFFWLMPHKVAVWIYWHALKLWWKSVSFVQHPRYNNPAYREEAVSRDKKLNCCKAGDFETMVVDLGSGGWVLVIPSVGFGGWSLFWVLVCVRGGGGSVGGFQWVFVRVGLVSWSWLWWWFRGGGSGGGEADGGVGEGGGGVG